MFGSMHVATIRDIPIKLHLSMVVVMFLFVSQLGIPGIPTAILLFGSVLLHELGHALVAQREGIPIASIELHLLGGTAMMSRPAARPSQEVRIALAGPLVSFLLAGCGLLTMTLLGGTPSLVPSLRAIDLAAYFTLANFGIGLFNLVPALPMDGGRVLRALLTKRQGALRATRIAARVSKVLALGFIVAGLYLGAWTLAMIGVAVVMLAYREEQVAAMQDALQSVRRASIPFLEDLEPLDGRFQPADGPADGPDRPWDRFDRSRWGSHPPGDDR
jgi:Zn-dependent protease